MAYCTSHETFLHFSLQSSHLNICYYHQDLHSSLFHPGLRPRLRHKPYALLLSQTSHLSDWSSFGPSLKRHPFSGLVHSAGELLHQLVPLHVCFLPVHSRRDHELTTQFPGGLDSILSYKSPSPYSL